MSDSRRIDQLLRSSSPLRQLTERAARLAELERRIQSRFPDTFAQVQIINLRQGVLVLQTESPARRTRLHYELPTLLSELRSMPELKDLRDIRLRLAPGHPAPAPKLPPLTLTATAAENLQAGSKGVSDPVLRDALLRLAMRGRNRRD